jgi:hypothetical protein
LANLKLTCCGNVVAAETSIVLLMDQLALEEVTECVPEIALNTTRVPRAMDVTLGRYLPNGAVAVLAARTTTAADAGTGVEIASIVNATMATTHERIERKGTAMAPPVRCVGSCRYYGRALQPVRCRTGSATFALERTPVGDLRCDERLRYGAAHGTRRRAHPGPVRSPPAARDPP